MQGFSHWDFYPQYPWPTTMFIHTNMRTLQTDTSNACLCAIFMHTWVYTQKAIHIGFLIHKKRDVPTCFTCRNFFTQELSQIQIVQQGILPAKKIYFFKRANFETQMLETLAQGNFYPENPCYRGRLLQYQNRNSTIIFDIRPSCRAREGCIWSFKPAMLPQRLKFDLPGWLNFNYDIKFSTIPFNVEKL